MKDRIAYLWFPFLVFWLLVVAWSPLVAAPVAIAKHEGITVILTDEKCELSAVSNLPYRATWEEKGKTHQGCFTVNSGIVVAYFSDKTVVILPGQVFSPLSGS